MLLEKISTDKTECQSTLAITIRGRIAVVTDALGGTDFDGIGQTLSNYKRLPWHNTIRKWPR